MAAERDTVDRLIAHLARRARRRDLRGPHPRRHPRRPVRRAGRERRRRLRADLDASARISIVYDEARPRAGRRAHRRDASGSATRSRCKLVEAAPLAGALRFELSARALSIWNRPAQARACRRLAESAPAQALQKASKGGTAATHPFDFRRFGTIFWACMKSSRKSPPTVRCQAARRLSGDVSRRALTLPALRRRPAFPPLPEGRRPLPSLQRGTASPPDRRRAALFHHPHRRPLCSVPLLIAFEAAFAPALWVPCRDLGAVTLAICLALLPVVKGAIVGLQWALYMHGFDPGAARGRRDGEGRAMWLAPLRSKCFPTGRRAITKGARSAPRWSRASAFPIRPRDAATAGARYVRRPSRNC